ARPRWRGWIPQPRSGRLGVRQRPASRADGRSRRWCPAPSLDAESGQAVVEIAAADRVGVLGTTEVSTAPRAGARPESAELLVAARLAKGRANGATDQLRARCAGLA